MPITSGTLLGRYEIHSPLGAGGMGEVYLARDTQLRRRVALKILPAELAQHRDRLRRFEQEAFAAAALNHPNIAHIYEIGVAGDLNFIAMEFVDGDTLRKKIHGDKTELKKLLEYLTQVAEGLAKAHAAGIVHRDLKPDNIMVALDGYAKVLDFGLAKLMEPIQSQNMDGGVPSEAATALRSQPGTVIGTVGYMSPEQAQGKTSEIDHRSDIFSFGCILYESVTGREPFPGGSFVEVLHKVVYEPPVSITDCNPGASADLQRIIRCCMAKNPDERYQSIKDVAIELKELRPATESSPVPRQELSVRGGRIKRPFIMASLAAAGVAVVILGLVVTSYLRLRPSEQNRSPQQHLISTFPGSHRAASFSPDGQKIAFVNAVDGVQQVWVTNLTESRPVQLTSGKDPADRPRWSPLGDQIVFVRQLQGTSSIWSIPPQGGTPRKVLEGGRSPNWSWDGGRLVFERGYDLWTANADGSEQLKVEGVPPTDLLLSDRSPAFSPDGSSIAFFQKSKGPHGDFWVIPAAGGVARRLTFDDVVGGRPVWTPDGRFIVFPSQRAGSMTLWKVPLAGGEPQPVLLSAGEDTDPEISRDGRRLIYANARNSYIVMLTDPATGQRKELHESRSALVDPSFSPRGDQILFFGFAGGGGPHLFTIKADGGNFTQLTAGSGEQNVHPQWSADGSAIYFFQHRPATSFRKLSLQDGQITELVRGWEWATNNHARVDPEGKRIIYTRLDKGEPAATMIRDIATGGETAFTILLRYPRWSRDGRFVAGTHFNGRQSPQELTICAAGGEPCRTLARGGWYYPHWSTDGSLIYFFKPSHLADGEELWVMFADGSNERKISDLRPMDPIGKFFDVSPTGQIVWVQYRQSLRELWVTDFSGS